MILFCYDGVIQTSVVELKPNMPIHAFEIIVAHLKKEQKR